MNTLQAMYPLDSRLHVVSMVHGFNAHYRDSVRSPKEVDVSSNPILPVFSPKNTFVAKAHEQAMADADVETVTLHKWQPHNPNVKIPVKQKEASFVYKPKWGLNNARSHPRTRLGVDPIEKHTDEPQDQEKEETGTNGKYRPSVTQHPPNTERTTTCPQAPRTNRQFKGAISRIVSGQRQGCANLSKKGVTREMLLSVRESARKQLLGSSFASHAIDGQNGSQNSPDSDSDSDIWSVSSEGSKKDVDHHLPAHMAKMRIQPKALTRELNASAEALAHAIDNMEIDLDKQYRTHAVVTTLQRCQIYLRHLTRVASKAEFQTKTDEIHDISPPMGIDDVVVTGLANYIVNQVCNSGVYDAATTSLFEQILKSLAPSLYDTTTATEEDFKTPHFLRLSHLKKANARIFKKFSSAEKRFQGAVNSLKMVVTVTEKRLTSLVFRVWRFDAKLFKSRENLVRFSSRQKTPQQATHERMLLFFYWRAWAKTRKLERIMNLETSRLQEMTTSVTSELRSTVFDAHAVQERMQLLASTLAGTKQDTTIMRADGTFSSEFLANVLGRCEKELAMLREMTHGRFPIFLLSGLFEGSGGEPPKDVDTAVQELLLLGQNWAKRTEVFEKVQQLASEEEEKEIEAYQELVELDIETLLVNWVNRCISHTYDNDQSSFRRRLKDLSTDLRDSDIYVALMKHVTPGVSFHKIEITFDLHSKAKSLLSTLAQYGCFTVMNENEFVEGLPDLHLAQLANLFLVRGHGLDPSPKPRWFDNMATRIPFVLENWRAIEYLERIPQNKAYDMLASLTHLCCELSICRNRLVRREKYWRIIQTKVKDFVWLLLRAYTSDTASYEIQHLNNAYQNGINEHMCARVLGKDDEDRAQWKEEAIKIKKIIAKYRGELKKINRHYTSESMAAKRSNSIDFRSYLTFVKDCGVLKGNIDVPLNDIYNCFTTVCELERKERGDEDDPDGVQEVDQGNFLEVIVRLANVVHRSHDTLSARVNELLEQDVLPNACRTSADEFRKLLTSETMRDVFAMNKTKLTSIFRRYSSLDDDERVLEQHLSMNLAEFTKLCRDAGLLGDSGFTTHKLKALFGNVQQDEDYGIDDPDESQELSYQEFLEALSAICLFHMPEPFTPLNVKFETFLEHKFFANLKTVAKKKKNSAA